jgi:exopolyphosphatase/guanosine-5'-triphosphate,3'-diphosphate pyrophosphatase
MNIASIDVGTNTVILLIAEITGNKFTTLYNEFRIPRIGKGLNPGGKITKEKISELLNILSGYKTIIDKYNCDNILAIATNAFRIASNAMHIIDMVKNETGINIEIISGTQEAEYSFLGAVSNSVDKNNDVLVIDIGGGSTELILGSPEKIKYTHSFPIGVVSGTESFFLHNPPLPSELKYLVDHLSWIFNGLKIVGPSKSIAIAGTPTTLACIQKGLTFYNEDKVEGSVLKIEDIKKLKNELKFLSPKQILDKYKTVVTGREDVLLAGTIILFELMTKLKIPEVIVSTRGIRYGVIYKKCINSLETEEN